MVRTGAAARAVVLGVGLGFAPGGWIPAQTHKVERPEAVVRAVGVYEWTGDLNKPQASRLVPVTVFIDGQLQDAGVYLARPIPFALLPGNAYELEQGGVAKGSVELASARRLQAADGSYDDGWFGYGVYKPEAAVKTPVLKASKTLSTISGSKDDSRPHFGNGTGDPGVTETGSGTNKSEGKDKVDPDRPTLRRRGAGSKSGSDRAGSNTAGSSTAGGVGSAPAEDPDRPVLKRHGQQKDASSNAGDASADREVATDALNNDPNRPVLHRGKPTGTAAVSDSPKADMAQSGGAPKDLHQMVAVSDAARRPEHDFARPWVDEAERAAVLATMQGLARARLTAYGTAASGGAGASAGVGPVPGAANGAAKPGARARPIGRVSPAVRRSAVVAAAARRAAATAAKRKAAASSVGPSLLEEDLRGYTLSYGGAPTYIYTAHTDGTGEALRYVTVVAQTDVQGKVQPAYASVTDAAHLDRTPWLRLVGAVDAEASNRASLLFEMREQTTRQFALLRVLGSRAETVFTTGTTQ